VLIWARIWRAFGILVGFEPLNASLGTPQFLRINPSNGHQKGWNMSTLFVSRYKLSERGANLQQSLQAITKT